MSYMTSREAKEVAFGLGKDKRQEVLNYIKKGNDIGDTTEYFNLDLMVVCEIINQNISKKYFINSEAI